MKLLTCGTLLLCLAAPFAAIPDPVNPDPNFPRPIEGVETLFTEEMTWMEVRDSLKEGNTTIIISTGGIEQNGPYLVTGKHNIVLKATTQAIARKLGKTLIAPIIPFVPEGDISPATEHMRYPGTVSVTEETFERLLSEVCRSFKQHGFKHLILIGDSGGNQAGMKAVAERLAADWSGSGPRIDFIPEYFNWKECGEFLKSQGIIETPEGYHDDASISSIMATVDPQSIRLEQRRQAGLAKINGVSFDPPSKAIEIGNKVIEFRANATVAAVKKLMNQ
jgi:creatinine amidohydrolase/Fe(II)-dependent formamide hydrolase-like protein